METDSLCTGYLKKQKKQCIFSNSKDAYQVHLRLSCYSVEIMKSLNIQWLAIKLKTFKF